MEWGDGYVRVALVSVSRAGGWLSDLGGLAGGCGPTQVVGGGFVIVVSSHIFPRKYHSLIISKESRMMAAVMLMLLFSA